MDITNPQQSEALIKVLPFLLGETNYAVKLSDVTEIIKITEIRNIPRVPAYIEGVLNLREEIVIVINLKKLLLVPGPPAERSKILIMDILDKKIGFIVDDVSKIIAVNDASILPPPPVVLSGPVPDCIFGVLEQNETNVLMLDLSKSLKALEEEGLNKVLEKELTYLINQINV